MSELVFELLIPKRPVSLQAKATSLQLWKEYVYGRAFQEWKGMPITNQYLCLTLVYFCRNSLLENSISDVDNIIKPIQDALVGIIFSDDRFISDVDCHRRFLTDSIEADDLPFLLRKPFLDSSECVYIRISEAKNLEEYL